MSGITCNTVESGWTKANLQKLLAAMKSCIPQHCRMSAYTQGLKAVDWSQVAFPPFSPEECQEKWRDILQKMRKMRTLTELIVEAEDVVSNPSVNMKIHPEIPKRPNPPNAIFYEENWAKFHEQHPKHSTRNLFRNLNEKYKKLPDEEKAQYVKKHQLAIEDYKRRMLEFRKQYHKLPNCKRETTPKRKRVSADNPDQSERCAEDEDVLPPKPPFNGYNLFCKEQLASMEGVSRGLYVSVWAQRWRDLSEAQRDEYSTRCNELKNEYSIKVNEYLMTLDEEERQRVLTKHGIKRPTVARRKVKLEKKHPDEPKMPPRSGNVIFYKHQMELLKETISNSRERFVKVSKLWMELPTKKKERYKERVHESVRKYSTELRKWFKTLSSAEQKNYLASNPSKCQYLDVQKTEVAQREELALYRPSDSEDEDIEESSSEEEEDDLVCEKDNEEEEDEEEQGDDIMFELF